MKKLLLIIVTLCVVIFCNAQTTTQDRNCYFQSMWFDQKGIKFAIDPRIELWNVIGIILGNPSVNPARMPYKEEILRVFSKYRSHPAMDSLLNTLKRVRELTWPLNFFLRLDGNLHLDPSAIDSNFVKSSGGIERLTHLSNVIKDFARKSDFYSFYNNHADFYKLILNNTKYNFSDFDEKQRIEGFYGQKKNSYTIVLNILEGSGNFGVNVKRNNKEDLYAVISCYSIIGSIPSFAPDFGFYDLVYHEFSHSFCNPLVYANSNTINKYENLFEPVKTSLNAQGYNNWLTAVHEHLVRVSSILLAEQKFGQDIATLKFYNHEIGKRFIYVKPLMEKLQEYQNNRNRYKTYSDFFPELMKAFEGVTSEEIKRLQANVEMLRLPEVENIPVPAKAKWDSTMVFIISTHENTAAGNDSVKRYAETFRDMIHNKIRIIKDDEIADDDLRNSDCVAFGTVNGNAFIKKNISRIPIIIKNDRVVFKDIFYASNLRMTVSWVNPVNPQKQMIFYTGQKAEDIRDYQYTPYKDGNNYWIGRNNVTISKGNFDRVMKIWMVN